MLELCFSSLIPCSHVMLSQRRRLRDLDSFGSTAKKFLSLRPACCLDTTWIHNFLHRSSASKQEVSPNLMVNYGSKVTESLYGNYHAYLYDAKQKIISCQIGCSYWSSTYDGISSTEDIDNDSGSTTFDPSYFAQKKMFSHQSSTLITSKKLEKLPKEEILNSIKSLIGDSDEEIQSSTIEENEDDTYNNLMIPDDKERLDADIDALLSEEIEISELSDEILRKNSETNVQIDSMFSLGDSSGYESLALKNFDDLSNEFETEKLDKQNISENQSINRLKSVNNNLKINNERQNSRNDVFNSKPTVGIFLDVILRKLEAMLSNNLYVNLHLTGLISRLAIYRQPLLQSFLLNPSLVFQPSIRSLFQVKNIF